MNKNKNFGQTQLKIIIGVNYKNEGRQFIVANLIEGTNNYEKYLAIDDSGRS